MREEDDVDIAKVGCSLTRKDPNGEAPLHDCSYSVVHFASCSVLRDDAEAGKFRERVGAACVSGYTKSVHYVESWAFELMYLGLISKLLKERNVNAGTLKPLQNKIKSKPEYSGLAEKLGFKMIFE